MGKDRINPNTGVTDREELFCLYYHADPEKNLKKCYAKAGYSEKTARVNASPTFNQERVQKFYNKLKEECQERNGLKLSADELLQDLIEIKNDCKKGKEIVAVKAIEMLIKHYVTVPKEDTGINLNINTTPFEINIVE